jgi:hypothetical protein
VPVAGQKARTLNVITLNDDTRLVTSFIYLDYLNRNPTPIMYYGTKNKSESGPLRYAIGFPKDHSVALGGLVVSLLAIEFKFRGFRPGRER